MHHFTITLTIGGIKGSFSILYPCESSFVDYQLKSEISNIGNVRLPTLGILIICPMGLDTDINTTLSEIRREAEGRSNAIKYISVLPYGIDGKLIKSKVNHLLDNIKITDELLEEIANKCIEAEISNTNYVLLPPHGYKFRKPSGHEVDSFFRAGNLLSVPGLLFVFCHLILRKMPENTRTIYIDSFTIYSFALRIQSLIAFVQRQSNLKPVVSPRIEIFPSYDVETSFRLPNSRDYFVIISASTSNGLAKKLVEKHNADNSRIVHLLGIGSVESGLHDSSIYFEEKSVVNQNAQKAKVIDISTEEFMVSYGTPTRVRLSTKHVCKNHADELSDRFYQDCLRVSNTADKFGYGPYSAFSIDQNPNCNWSKGFKNWLENKLLHELPVTTKSIVYLDDRLSKKIGKQLHTQLSNKIKVKEISLLSNCEFNRQICEHLPESSAVVIVAIQDAGLEQLGKLSMLLRLRQDVHQHYVLGYAFPESKAQFKRMTYDLTLVPEPTPKYGLSNFLLSPVGHSNLHESISTDYGIDRNQVKDLLPKLDYPEQLISRLCNGAVESSSAIGSEIFFPSLKGESLKLRGGSIFFANHTNSVDEDDSPQLSQEVVYFAVSLALQQAREEDDSLTPHLKFDGNPFVRTVIDPRMFWRFNDGILQAALLRALSESELDFASNDEMSADFRKITISVLENASNFAGEAALEFFGCCSEEKSKPTRCRF